MADEHPVPDAAAANDPPDALEDDVEPPFVPNVPGLPRESEDDKTSPIRDKVGMSKK